MRVLLSRATCQQSTIEQVQQEINQNTLVTSPKVVSSKFKNKSISKPNMVAHSSRIRDSDGRHQKFMTNMQSQLANVEWVCKFVVESL